MSRKVTITALEIRAIDAQEETDEAYLFHNLKKASTPTTQAQDPVPGEALLNATPPYDLKDGEAIRNPRDGRDRVVLFDGEVGDDELVTGTVYLADEDGSEFGERGRTAGRVGFLVGVGIFLLGGVGGGFGTFLALIPTAGLGAAFITGLAVGLGGLVAGIALGVLTGLLVRYIGGLDSDDLIGARPFTYRPRGIPNTETRTLKMSGTAIEDIEGGAELGDSDAEYEVDVFIFEPAA